MFDHKHENVFWLLLIKKKKIFEYQDVVLKYNDVKW